MSTARLVTLGLLVLSSCILRYEEEPEGETDTGSEFEPFETDKPLSPGDEGGGTVVCGAPGSNSFVTDADACACEDGLAWCSGDPSDYTCCPPPSGSTGA